MPPPAIEPTLAAGAAGTSADAWTSTWPSSSIGSWPEPSSDAEPAGWSGAWSDPEPASWSDPTTSAPDPWASRRWTDRWLPASWRGARWDPGRAGAVGLAAVAAIAAVVAAVGVWSGRPTTEPVPPLPSVAGAFRPAGAGSTGSGANGTGTNASGASSSATPDAGGPIMVSVSGRVAHPGLLRLPDGSRVGEAITTAGGPVPGADLTGLNLAQRLADGDQVVVGVPGMSVSSSAPTGAPDASRSGSAGSGSAGSGSAGTPRSSGSTGTGRSAGHGTATPPGGKVDLNTATLEQFDQLPGVGPATAQKIVDWRTQHGRFASVEQLQEVGGIGAARMATLRTLVVV